MSLVSQLSAIRFTPNPNWASSESFGPYVYASPCFTIMARSPQILVLRLMHDILRTHCILFLMSYSKNPDPIEIQIYHDFHSSLKLIYFVYWIVFKELESNLMK